MIRHVSWTTGGKYCLQRQDEYLHRFFSAMKFRTKEVRPQFGRYFSFENHLHNIFKALRKLRPVCPFNLAVKFFRICGEMPSKPALEPLAKDTRALWTKNSEVGKQSISVGSGSEQVSFLRMFQLEGSVVVDRQICNLVVAYCHFDSCLNIAFV